MMVKRHELMTKLARNGFDVESRRLTMARAGNVDAERSRQTNELWARSLAKSPLELRRRLHDGCYLDKLAGPHQHREHREEA